MNLPLRTLILCTGNSARSIFGEYLLRRIGGSRFETHSGGALPTGRVNPLAIRVLRENYDIDASGARSKSWDEYRGMHFDYVITVCDHARDVCPVWREATVVSHWSSPDPAAVTGSEEERYRAFASVAAEIAHRMKLLCALPPHQQFDAKIVASIGSVTPPS